MSVLAAHDLVKAFGAEPIVDGATLVIEEGERVGIVGLNGAGKSTLAKMLAGLETTDAGTLAIRRGVRVHYLEQAPQFEPGRTVHDVVAEGLLEWAQVKRRYEEISDRINHGETSDDLLHEQADLSHDVERLGGWNRAHIVDEMIGHLGLQRPEADVATLSGGERRRVALARLLVAQPAIAIFDEPTNHLDVTTIEWLENYLINEYKGALVLITHDRYLLDRVVQRTVELHRGKLYSYEGGYEDYLEAKAERLAQEARTEANRQNFLRTELDWLRRQPKARTTKQKARIERAQSAKAAPQPKAERTATITVEQARTGKTILELHDVGVDLGGRTLIKSLSFMLTKGERLGIVGANGAGKTTLLKVLRQQLEPTRGRVEVGLNTKIAYFDQERSGLDLNASVFDNVVGDQPKIEVGGHPIEPRSYLERFLFEGSKQRQPVGSLSGGERARVALARMLRQSANLIILDEPTNDLDLPTLSALETMLLEMSITALVVTHDRWFLDRIATGIIAFEGEGKVTSYAGGYSAFREQQSRTQAALVATEPTSKTNAAASVTPTAAASPSNTAGASQSSGSSKKGLSWKEQHELSTLLEEIDHNETAVKTIEAELSDPSTHKAGGDRVRELNTQLEEANAELERLMVRWEELEAKKGA